MARTRVKFYVGLSAKRDSENRVVGISVSGTTLTPSKAGIPVEIELDVDNDIFEPLRFTTGALTINASPATAPEPVATVPSEAGPPSLYGRALERARAAAEE